MNTPSKSRQSVVVATYQLLTFERFLTTLLYLVEAPQGTQYRRMPRASEQIEMPAPHGLIDLVGESLALECILEPSYLFENSLFDYSDRYLLRELRFG